MKAFEIFQSIKSWQKLAGIVMKPAIAFKILRYTKLVSAEFEHIEKQRVDLAYEVSGTPRDQNVQLEPETPELVEFQRRFSEVLNTESTLPLLRLDLETVVNALDGKEDVLTVSDLATLEPFFQYSDPAVDGVIDVEVVEATRECDESVAKTPK